MRTDYIDTWIVEAGRAHSLDYTPLFTFSMGIENERPYIELALLGFYFEVRRYRA